MEGSKMDIGATIGRVRKEYREHLQEQHPDWADSTISTHISDAFYLYQNTIALSFWEWIASAICDELESSVRGKKITTHSSITAKAFFEHRGYRVIQKQTVIRNGISLTNYMMEK